MLHSALRLLEGQTSSFQATRQTFTNPFQLNDLIQRLQRALFLGARRLAQYLSERPLSAAFSCKPCLLDLAGGLFVLVLIAHVGRPSAPVAQPAQHVADDLPVGSAANQQSQTTD